MLLQELNRMNQLNEAPLDMPADADGVRQLEILMHKVETAKKALGLANRLTDPVDRKKHQSRVLVLLNQLRAAFNKVADELEAEIKANRETA